MLRNFMYSPGTDKLTDILERFGLKLDEKFPLAVLRFEVITPDSFMWRLLVNDAVYYVYAEDFIPGFEHVKDIFKSYLKSEDWDFVKPTKVISFESSGPVQGASVYKPPEDTDEMMQYAIDSGYDFVFLIKSHEDMYNT